MVNQLKVFTAFWETKQFHAEGFFEPQLMAVEGGKLRIELAGAPALVVANALIAPDIYFELTGKTLSIDALECLFEGNDKVGFKTRLGRRQGFRVRRYEPDADEHECMNGLGHVLVWPVSARDAMEHLVETEINEKSFSDARTQGDHRIKALEELVKNHEQYSDRETWR